MNTRRTLSRLPAATACFVVALLLLTGGCLRKPAAIRYDTHPSASALTINNPYAKVDWDNHGRYRANLHTHTTGSDGSINPHDVIDRYHALGYRILAITDHNAVTYPWTALTDLPASNLASNQFADGNLESETLIRENRDPGALGMFAIEGNELSSHHHMGSFFNDHNGTTTETASLDAIAAKDGLAMLYHPGRYSKSTDWYVDLYQRYPHLIGLEVYNQGDRYPGDRAIWDAILTEMMPGRPVWGYSNDDMHRIHQLGRNYSVMLLPELTEDTVRQGMREGWHYFVYSPQVSELIANPVISRISVNEQQGRIRIHADGPHETVWISNGREVHRGNTINLTRHQDLGAYIRAELHGEDGIVVATQPFGLVRPVRSECRLPMNPGDAVYADDDHLSVSVTFRNVSDHTVEGMASVMLENRLLAQRHLRLNAGDTVDLPVELPIKALNKDRMLISEFDLGRAHGRLRRITTRLPTSIPLPVDVTVTTPSVRHAVLRIENRLGDHNLTMNAKVSLDGVVIESIPTTLTAGDTTEIECPLPAELFGRMGHLDIVTTWAKDINPVRGQFSKTIDFRDINRLPRKSPPAMTNIALVASTPSLIMRTVESVMPEARRDRWTGPDDLSVRAEWGWDGKVLWITAVIQDDTHANSRDGADIWNGDSLQIAVAPQGLQTANLAFALTNDGLQIYQYYGHDDTLLEHTQFNIERDDEAAQTRYHVRLPLDRLGINAKAGSLFGMSIVVFDDDDNSGYDAWMQMSPGIAGGWDPDLLPRFTLNE